MMSNEPDKFVREVQETLRRHAKSIDILSREECSFGTMVMRFTRSI